MSELEAKLAAPNVGAKGPARATLEQLQRMWGFEATQEEATRVVVWLVGMDGQRQAWVRIQGTGKSAIFEKCETISTSPEGDSCGQ